MTDKPKNNTEGLPDSLLEEAAIWYARLREPTEDEAARQAEFEQWLQADSHHQQAFEQTEQLWDKLEVPVAHVLSDETVAAVIEVPKGSSETVHRPRAIFPRAMAIAASIFVLMLGGAIWQEDIFIGLTSDYTTVVGEKTPLDLEDGSRITLNTNSAITVDLASAHRHVRLLRGEAWFDVSSEDTRPFFVETQHGMVRVTGTSFDVRLDGDYTIVSLTEGQVKLTTPTARVATNKSLVILKPAQQAMLSAEGISEITPFDETIETAWLRGQFVFYDANLSDVIAALNRHRSGRIIVMDDALNDLKISGVFSTGDTGAALKVIADTLPIKVSRLTDYLVMLNTK